MSALVVMMLVGYLLLIAFALTLWAAFTLRGGRGADDERADDVEVVRAAPEQGRPREPTRSARVDRPDAPRPPSWTPSTGSSIASSPASSPTAAAAAVPASARTPAPPRANVSESPRAGSSDRRLSNDDVRGLRARQRRARAGSSDDRSAPARVREATGPGHDEAEAAAPPWRRDGSSDRTGSDGAARSDDAAGRRKRGEEAFERFLRAEERKR